MRPCVGSAHLTPRFTNGLTQARAPLFLPKVPPCLVSAKEGITASKELVAYFLIEVELIYNAVLVSDV